MKKNFKMKSALVVLLSFSLFPTVSLAAVKDDSGLMQATTAALVMQSLQLGEQAQQLFGIKDNLIKIVKTKKGNFTSQERLMVDVANEIKYIATVAYFEGNLLGAVLAIKNEFKIHFIENRIVELDNVFSGTVSSLQPIQVAHSEIDNTAAKNKMVKTIEIVESLLQTYRNSVEVLQKIKEKELAKQNSEQKHK